MQYDINDHKKKYKIIKNSKIHFIVDIDLISYFNKNCFGHYFVAPLAVPVKNIAGVRKIIIKK
jgi:glycerol-3-phosphate responsive antiterminator